MLIEKIFSNGSQKLFLTVFSESRKSNTLKLLLVCLGKDVLMVVLPGRQKNSLGERFTLRADG